MKGSTAAVQRENWTATLEHSAHDVFQLMLDSKLEVPAESPAEHRLDITSMVGLAGRLCGVLSIRCSADSAASMARRMLGSENAVSDAEMWDAVGEISNMIAGNFKKMVGLGEGCMLSVPTVITGADYRLHTLVNEHIRTVMLYEAQPFVIALEIHGENDPHSIPAHRHLR